MKLSTRFCRVIGLLSGLAVGAGAVVCGGALPTVEQTRATFVKPPRGFSSAPLWVWNDMLTGKQIRETMQDLAAQDVKQVFVHPRPGLMTPYLSEDWFALWRVALDEARKLDMNVWIYDENSYPSGFAGGWVPETMPESRGRGLSFKESATVPGADSKAIAVYELGGGAAQGNPPARVRMGESSSAGGPFLVATMDRSGNSPWHGNRSYVDLLYPGVTEKFLDITMGAYRRELGAQFGKRIPGVFTDEPNIRPAGGLPWTEDLPERFKQRWGYDLLGVLPSLVRPLGDWRKVRHNYFCLLNELFIERWGKPYYEWCAKNGMEFTGHYWDHDWPECVGVPDNMSMYAWHQRPAIDCLMNQYAENTHAQFGNIRIVKELSSVANQLGRDRTLCELYGAGGWDLRFEDMKRIADWLGVLGVNTMDQHLSYVTIRGARKRDHPQSFSYHEPWWKAYRPMGTYLTRLSVAVSQGRQVNRILVMEPTTTAWMYQGDHAKLGALGDAFFNLLKTLEAAQVEYDIGCEDIMARHGSVADGKLKVGEREYSVVLLPPLMENLNAPVRDMLEKGRGGAGPRVFRLSAKEDRRVDGGAVDATASVGQEVGEYRPMSEAFIREQLMEPGGAASGAGQDFAISRLAGDRGILFHQRRVLADGELLFLVNTSLEHYSQGAVATPFQSVVQWDLFTGREEAYPSVRSDGMSSVRFDLPPSGSLLLVLSNKASKRTPWSAETEVAMQAVGASAVHRMEPNVMTLDYVDVSAGGETRTNVYFYKANQFLWQKHGMERNPWDSAVQFKNELISHVFPTNSGFTATYRFNLQCAVPQDLEIVIERPDLYVLSCNGQAVKASAGAWWLDKAFGRVPLAAIAREGENTVTLTATNFTMFHELESAYLRGDFALRAAERGFDVVAAKPIELRPAQPVLGHSNNPDGTMWLSGGIGFQKNPNGSAVEDRHPSVTFDLGKSRDVACARVWNYCEGHVTDLSSRGVRRMRVLAGTEPGVLEDRGVFELARTRGPGRSQDLKIGGKPARYLKFVILANHAGVEFPAVGEPADNGFVGLAEVRFLEANGAELSGVSVQGVSGELRPHNRLAAYLLDGSGLGRSRAGWNDQGHPFYSAGVSYKQEFQVTERGGKYVVALPSWYGSVAEVRVQGKPAGTIMAPPWECDITKHVRKGLCSVEVIVYGTLKNTLGPHHGNQGLGSAWPGMFQNGPADGQPAGAAYATVGYGMFEPFVLKHLTER